MGTPGKGMLLIAGPGRVMLTATGKTAIVQASGVCCECNCCIATVYACICDTAVTIPVNGAVQTVDVSDCCTCVETPVELDVWVACAEPDPPTIPITYLLTLHWEFRCGDDTPVTGSVSVDDLCDAGTIIENAISVAGCAFGDSFSADEADLELCCGDACITIGDCGTFASGDIGLTSCGTNAVSADPEDQVGLLSFQWTDPIPRSACRGDNFTLFAVWDAGRNAETTANIVFKFTFPDCIDATFVSAEATYEDSPIRTVTGSAVWTGNILTITFANVPALNEIQNTAEIVLTLEACCCEVADTIEIEIDHALDPTVWCGCLNGCDPP